MIDHPSLDELADLAAGVAADATLAEHVAGCADCASDLAQIEQVSAALHELPPEPIPLDIAARIDAALAAERAQLSAPATVVPLSRRPRRAVPSWVAAAAAAVVLFGGGALLVSNLQGHSADTSGGSVSAAKDLKGRQVIRSSGLDYRAATLADQLPTLLGQVAADRESGTTGGAAAPLEAPSATRSTLTQPKSTLADRTKQLNALKSPSALAACLVRALGADIGEPIAVDLAQFNGEPAVLVALPALGRTDKVDVYVLDPGCPEGLFVYFARLPLPAPR